MRTEDRWIADAAKRATILWLASYRLNRAIATKDEKKVLKEAARLQESLRQ